MTEIHGTCDKRFEAVRDALAESLDKADVGASVAVYLGDQPVVDIWGGYADATRTKPWERDTITNVFSSTKTMTALCALILADRGVIDLDAPVAKYWPEFRATNVLVRHALSHTAGLPDWDPPIAREDLLDWDRATALLARQTPQWEPGTAAGYHSMTFGHLVGEVVRRATGRTLATFFAEEVAGPLGADFHITLPAEHDHRVSLSIAPPESPDGDWTAGTQVYGPEHGIRLSEGNSLTWRRTEFPATGGIGNARSMAAVQSVLANGGTARGIRLLSEAGCARASEEQFNGEDQLLGMSMRWGMGYALFGNTCAWGGWGGSIVMVDPTARLTVAYAMNQMMDPRTAPDERAMSFMTTAYTGLR
ncbi:serine hydrolase domain-containing protein [Actinocrispum wychmicini]|uniref:CubicO group peptidase (Beta-lactamase class C family) n=1 Tax=Actinocrispum wychmicini TaxID=1213861 RepID=A0A4R2IHB7_9PSEU|nr:serine hydrolase domain-containing protein [Actinocrispum wychmicini]TCO44204.1 CubicO group peptidase (beta-lactamase class C family) [Actinocrispum wychmicini]